MKKSKLLLKSLIGVPIGIFVLELFNIWLSIATGQYARFDAIDMNLEVIREISLNNVLISYLFCAITSYLLMIYLNYTKYVLSLELSVKEEKKHNKKVYPIMMAIIILFGITCYMESTGAVIGILASMVWSGVFIIIVAIETLFNKYSIKQINEKLKESFKD